MLFSSDILNFTTTRRSLSDPVGRLPAHARRAYEAIRKPARTVVTNSSGDATVWLYDLIGYDRWSGEGVSAKDFASQLADLGDVKTITLKINSPGGDVFDAVSMYTLLRQHPARVSVEVDALAASAATIVAMAGNSVVIARNGMFMIHDASGGVMGNGDDMLQMAALLKKIDGQIADVYAQRSGRNASVFRDMMKKETWLDAAETVKAGLADRVMSETGAGATNRHDHRPPQAVLDARRARLEADRQMLEGDWADEVVEDARRKVAERRRRQGVYR